MYICTVYYIQYTVQCGVDPLKPYMQHVPLLLYLVRLHHGFLRHKLYFSELLF